MAQTSVAASGITNPLTARWQQFARWWLAGLQELVPAAWRNWAEGEVLPRLLIWRDGESVMLRLVSASGMTTAEAPLPAIGFGAAELQMWLSQQGLSRDEVSVGPVISSDQFLLRELSVPRVALEALPRILDQEVVRRTPFALAEIWHAATPVAGAANEPVAMCHWIIRKDRAEASLAKLGLRGSDVDFLAAADTTGQVKPVISFRSGDDADPPWAIRAVRLLAVAALAVSVAGLVIFDWRQSSIASALEASLAEARQSAQGGRDGIDPAGRLLALKADVSVLEVWEELSRILPDHTFLTETRVADGKATVSGFSTDAARLVRIIDQSPLFTGAALTAAITPDATERRDRFSISFKVRGTRSAASVRRTAP